MITEMLKIGANAYLTKNDDVEEIYNAIIGCYTKGQYLNEKNTMALLETIREIPKPKTYNSVPVVKVEVPKKEVKKKKFNIWKVLLWGVSIAVISSLSIYFYLILKNNLETISNIDLNIN
jgi:DNA-binding NarL/FixJ family response regulator